MAAPGRSGSLARGRTEGRQLASGTPLYLVHLQDHPQNEGVFSQGRFSKEDEAPPEARRTTSKCPLKRRTLQSPELAEISLLLVSGRIFLFFVFLFFLFFLFSFFFSFFFFFFSADYTCGQFSNIFNSSFGGEKDKWARPHPLRKFL